jgi:hypothetical protein
LRDRAATLNSRSTRPVHEVRCRRRVRRHPADRDGRIARGHAAHNLSARLYGSYVVGEYRLVSSNITRFHLPISATVKRQNPNRQPETHTHTITNTPT